MRRYEQIDEHWYWGDHEGDSGPLYLLRSVSVYFIAKIEYAYHFDHVMSISQNRHTLSISDRDGKHVFNMDTIARYSVTFPVPTELGITLEEI